jgi:hypothetical protein
MEGVESQTSVAVADPVAEGAVDDPHWTVVEDGTLKEGEVVSLIVMVWVKEAVLPQLSVYDQNLVITLLQDPPTSVVAAIILVGTESQTPCPVTVGTDGILSPQFKLTLAEDGSPDKVGFWEFPSQQVPWNCMLTQVCPAEAAFWSTQVKQATAVVGVEEDQVKVLDPGLLPAWLVKVDPTGRAEDWMVTTFPASGSLHCTVKEIVVPFICWMKVPSAGVGGLFQTGGLFWATTLESCIKKSTIMVDLPSEITTAVFQRPCGKVPVLALFQQ